MIAAEAERLATPPDGPVIAAGSTGSMPATARFLSEVAKLPQGAVVLPGLDTELDEPAWDLIGGVRMIRRHQAIRNSPCMACSSCSASGDAM